MSQKHLMFSDNTAWGLFNFRGVVIRHFLKRGFRVSVCVPYDAVYVERLRSMGCGVHVVSVDSHGVNPVRDVGLIRQYYGLMRRLRPDASITYTVKPNLYAGLTASWLGIPYLPVVPGAGQAFVRRSAVTEVVKLLYKIAFRRAGAVWFLNEEDMALFRSEGLVSANKMERLDGEGIDLADFPMSEHEGESDSLTFLMIGRLLREKGVAEYAEAARLVKANYPQVRFRLLGMVDETNRNAITRQELETWQRAGIVDYLGATGDVLPYLQQADCVVLPSYYREGIPRSLMEGAAVGLPLITTDNTGCREVVRDGVNGLLCRAKDARSLAAAMTRMLELSAEERRRMGLQGRRLMEERFDVRLIVQRYDEAVERLVGGA